ncbi:mechanosensitive ion channel domain-containing protein [Paraburkholderia sp. BL6665CI2N2]|uniref:mechanosensitive ion channel family protein n=1 Tax=Paraburkholderia sp. BL6665CI2N2 TaxID=1938806 RepID=UPI001FBA212A|nr:mechanosensitive ion channel domain-containing protein [Paraburkholderia sp. BL6665CI2N2]
MAGVFGDIAGSIERIGLKSTRIRSLSGEEIICSNTELLKNTIHNYKRMTERRSVFGFGVTYSATPDQLRTIPDKVRQAVEDTGDTRIDRAHFRQIGGSSLDFEVVYYVTDPAFNLYMDIQQKINRTLMSEFSDASVEFAFPTHTLHVATAPGASLRAVGQSPKRRPAFQN